MPHLTFAQSERRNLVRPILIALAVLLSAATALYLYFPHRIADITVTHTAVLPTQTVFETDSKVKVVGHHQQVEQDFYVLLTIHIDNKLRIPLFLSDITGTLTTADDSVATTSAVDKNDLSSVYTAFPAIRPLAGPPLLRESTIQPHSPAEGMILLHFPISQTVWDNRKSATLTFIFYNQAPVTLTIPKE